MDLDAIISKTLRREHEEQRAAHTPSGKLSASQLSKPLLEQVLKIIGVPEKPIEDYTLRLFKRGNQVEDWIVSMLPDGEEQKEVEYKGVIGFVDKMLDEPVEIKSVKSSQWKWLQKQGARWSHKLQGGLYALGTDSDKYQILYVVADDFRTMSFIYETKDIKDEIDGIINEVKRQLIKGELPPFEAREPWQEGENYSKYSPYPEFISLDPDLAMTKLKNSYPNAYEKLKSYSKKIKEATNATQKS